MLTKHPNIIHLKEVSSTNEYAKDLLHKDTPPEGTAIIADYQTAGKGHDQNSWESKAGENILLTMILYPDFLEISRQFQISMAVALGITDFLEELIPAQELFIKWPNDIYVGDKKIGGILINNEIMGDKFKHVMAGIGINVNQEAFSTEIPNPVSLSNLTGKQYSLKDLTLRLYNCVTVRYEQLKEGSYHQIKGDYLDLLLGLNQVREYLYKNKKIEAQITGVNEFGHLMLNTDGGSIECDLKEIKFLFKNDKLFGDV